MVSLSFSGLLGLGSPSFATNVTDLEVGWINGAPVLYSATRCGPGAGYAAYDLSGGSGAATLSAVQPYSAAISPSWTPQITLFGGRLYAAGLGASGYASYGLGAGGSFGAALNQPLPFKPTTVAGFQDAAGDYLFMTPQGSLAPQAYRMGAGGALTAVGAAPAGGYPTSGPAVDASSLVQTGFGTFLLTASAGGDRIQAYSVGGGGTLALASEVTGASAIGLSQPHTLASVTLHGATFVLAGSAQSSSLTAFRLLPGGALFATDHVVDSQNTRFDSATALATLQLGERAYVAVGGADGGVDLMTLLPDGRLIHLLTVADTAATSLDHVTSLSMAQVGARTLLFAASATEAGISQFDLSLGPQGLSIFRDAGVQTGSAANDLMVGGRATTALYGGDGDDILVVGGPGGGTELAGGAGGDLFVVGESAAPVHIADFQAGIDRLDLTTLPGLRNLGQLILTQTATGATIDYQGTLIMIDSWDGNPLPLTAFPLSQLLRLDRYAPSTTTDFVLGGAGNDVLRAGVDPASLLGFAGNDSVVGGTGADMLSGDMGADTLAGGGGDDSLYGGAMDDRLSGEAGNDSADGGQGNDWLDGGNGDDSLLGADGTDLLYGGADNDYIDGGIGGDRLYGDNGSDTMFGGVDGDFLYGGDGGDVLDGGAGTDLIYGEAGNDTLLGDLGDDRLEGGAGDDRLDGGAGNDALVCGDGNDSVFGGDGVDLVWGGAGANLIAGGAGNDAMIGFLGDDTLLGDDGNDIIFGSEGNDSIQGGAGADQLYGHQDNDTISGDDGDDRLFADIGNDVLFGGAGRDWIDGGAGNDTLDGGTDADSMVGGAGDDQIYGGDGNDVIVAEDGRDLIRCGFGSDIVVGQNGNDTLYGEAGNDSLAGGAGDDMLYGGADSDWIWGDDGNDTIDGGAGVDFLLGGAGNDSVVAGAGNDIVAAEAGNDYVDAGSGDDLIHGAAGDDTIFGGSDDDLILGQQDNDYIYGDSGADTLVGDIGNDVIVGGDDADLMGGGPGADRFVFAAVSDLPATGPRDRIVDFTRGADRLDFTGLGLHFGGNGALTGHAGEVVFAAGVGGAGGGTLWIDLDGDMVADGALRLDGVLALGGGDFLF